MTKFWGLKQISINTLLTTWTRSCPWMGRKCDFIFKSMIQSTCHTLMQIKGQRACCSGNVITLSVMAFQLAVSYSLFPKSLIVHTSCRVRIFHLFMPYLPELYPFSSCPKYSSTQCNKVLTSITLQRSEVNKFQENWIAHPRIMTLKCSKLRTSPSTKAWLSMISLLAV